jgi:hypothetical protein
MRYTNSSNLLSGCLLLAIVGLLVVDARANGHLIARPAESFLVKATCTDKDLNKQVVFRAAIKSGDVETSTLHVRGQEGEEDIQLYEISHITFSDNTNVQDFADASVTLRSAGRPVEMKVRIADKDKAFSVVGFDKNRNRIAVILTKCKEIEISWISKTREGVPEASATPKS